MDYDLKPNSHKFKEEQAAAATEKKKVEKVVTGAVRTKKKSGFSKFFGGFISEDAPNAKTYIFEDVIIPMIKKGIVDFVDIIVNGRKTRNGKSGGVKVSYRSFYDDPRDSTPVRTTYNYDEVILDSRGEAEEVLCQMNDLIDTYGVVSVADLYDLVGITGDYTANKYGWTNIRNAEAVPVRGGGWLLKMPKALPLK